MSVDKAEMLSWIQQVTGTNNCSIEIEGTTEKGAGYVGEFYFLKVEINEQSDDKKELYLAIKVGKNSAALRKKLPMIHALYQREIFFYEQAYPTLKNWQSEKYVRDPFDALPHCYKTFLDKNSEVVIMENMKKKGYELHPKQLPMNTEHLKMCLKNYAKFHALSFALQDQQKDIFDKITENYYEHLVITLTPFKPMYENHAAKVVDTLIEVGREDLANKYKKFIGNSVFNQFRNAVEDIPDEKVLIHGDCHNSNLLFKYEDPQRNVPSHMVLLDFQTSSVHSPMLDISDFLYLNLSKEGFSEFDDLMEFYYTEFSSFLSELGSDATKLFPRSTMWDHWRRFSNYGFFFSSVCMVMLFIDKDNAPVMNENEAGEVFENFLNLKVTRKDKYLERLLPVLEHYFSFHDF